MLTPTEQTEIQQLARTWARATAAYERNKDSYKRLGSPVAPLLQKAKTAEQALADYLKEVG